MKAVFRMLEFLGYCVLGRCFVAARTRQGAIQRARRLSREGFGITLNFLGEHHQKHGDVEEAVQEFLALIRDMKDALGGGSIAVKPSQIGLEVSGDCCAKNLDRILDEAVKCGIGVEVDAEHSRLISSTYRIAGQLAHNPAYRRILRLAVQANIRGVEELVSANGLAGIPLRIVKGGAYDEAHDRMLSDESEIRNRFVALFWRYAPHVQHHRAPLYLATIRDRALVDRIRSKLPNPRESALPLWQFQMLYGPWKKLQRELLGEGYRVNLYIPYGRSWFSYGLRRWRFLAKVAKESLLARGARRGRERQKQPRT